MYYAFMRGGEGGQKKRRKGEGKGRDGERDGGWFGKVTCTVKLRSKNNIVVEL